VQLGLFWEVERSAHLVAVDHPRPVYYDIWLERKAGCGFRVRKASGIRGRKPNVRTWAFDSLSAAEMDFERRLRAKLNLERKAPRRYVLRWEK
jgi:hypothetical protein